MLEAGDYFGQLKQWGIDEPKEGKTPSIWLEFNVSHVSAKGAWVETGEQKRTIYLFISDAAWPYTMEKLNRLGFNGNFGTMDFGDEAKNRGVQLTCRHEEYKGKSREKWDLFYEGGSASYTEASPDTIRRLNAKWKAQSTPAPASKPKPPAPASRAADNSSPDHSPIEEKDIPF